MSIFLKFVGWCLPFINTLVGRVMLALGFGFVEFTGLNMLIDAALVQIRGSFAEFSAVNYGSIIEWAGFLKIDVHISILISAIGAKVLLNSLNGPTFRRRVATA